MPQEAIRFPLEYVELKAKRVQDVTEEEARKGVKEHRERLTSATQIVAYKNYRKSGYWKPSAKGSFRTLIIAHHGSEAWDQNLWAWFIHLK